MLFSSRNTAGVVTREADPNNHNYISYEYTVEEKKYSGISYGPNHADMRKGQAIIVYYPTKAPSESLLLGPDEQKNYVAISLLVGGLIGMFAGFVDYWMAKRK